MREQFALFCSAWNSSVRTITLNNDHPCNGVVLYENWWEKVCTVDGSKEKYNVRDEINCRTSYLFLVCDNTC